MVALHYPELALCYQASQDCLEGQNVGPTPNVITPPYLKAVVLPQAIEGDQKTQQWADKMTKGLGFSNSIENENDKGQLAVTQLTSLGDRLGNEQRQGDYPGPDQQAAV
eukprot:c34327_g1_i1 orf=2-325(-)